MPYTRSSLIVPCLLLVCLSVFTSALAQKSSTSLTETYRSKDYPNSNTTITSALQEIRKDLQLSAEDLRPIKKSTSMKGIVHDKYQQYYFDTPVYGSRYILHSKVGRMLSSNGYLAANIDMRTVPTLSQSEAENIAYSHSKGEHFHQDRVQPIELVVIDRAFPNISNEYALTYKVEVYSSDPLDKKIYFIDAHTGHKTLELPGLIHNTTPAIAHTKYHGEQEIITESQDDGSYLLQDLTRGDGITTYNHDFTPFRNQSTEWDLTNANKDEVALDAHYATEKFYDMMLQRFEWNGLDGDGKSMNPVVHIGGGSSIVNAFWDGHYAYFGDGDCHRGPLTTLEVVGHEFMHGITDYTSDLIYSFESGAINESMSDIFGKAVEYYFAPDEFDWQIGESFLLTDLIEPFRYMDDPKKKNMSSYYKGQNWTDGGGVHQHSAIGNLWFHLLVEGRSDTTELGDPYTVEGIGMDKAIEIVWQVQSNYLTPTSGYVDMYESSLIVASTMFGEESPELADVLEAWRAVGLPQLGVGSSSYQHDIGVLIDFIPQRQCLRNEFLPFTVRLVNFGTEDVPDSSGIILMVDDPNSSQDANIEIFESIKSGESLSMTFDSTMYLTEPGRAYIEASALYEIDQNLRNNNYNLRPYRIDNYDPVYNSLEYELVDINRSCFDDSIHFDVYIENLSCNALETNTIINYTILDTQGEIIKENFYLLDKPLPSGERFTTADFVTGSYSEISLDAYTDTNAAIDRIPNVVVFENQVKIVGNYFNDLSDVDRNLTELEIFNIENIVDYNGHQYFAKGGGTNEEFFYPCPEDIQDFQSVQGYHNGYSKISACVDLSEIDNPVLSFDLVQFRDDSNDLPELKLLRCRAKVTWGTGINDYLVIDNQQEGIEINHKINLPNNFVGNFSIEFVNLTGTFLGSDVDNYISYDVNMIRNLEIKSSTNTTDQIKDAKITVSPNPGSGLYQIDSPYPIESVNITNVQGQSLSTRYDTVNNQINITSLDNGYYIFTFHMMNGSQISKSIIHLKP